MFGQAAKSLLRTKGIVSIGILTTLLTFFSFLAVNASLFLNHWHGVMVTDLQSEIGFAQTAPLLASTIFKGMAFILAAALLFATVGYLRRTFLQLAIMEKEEFFTMYLLGQSIPRIGIEFGLQAVYATVFFFSIGIGCANFLFHRFLMDAEKSGLFANIIPTFSPSWYSYFLLVFTSLLYIFARTFLAVKKQFNKNTKE
ncbi:hypothetical protein BAU16_06390 [Enterococcus sp. JM9B]|nr:hypothetical protein BAU16_06390 [Enterococcus sp. JM9B]